MASGDTIFSIEGMQVTANSLKFPAAGDSWASPGDEDNGGFTTTLGMDLVSYVVYGGNEVTLTVQINGGTFGAEPGPGAPHPISHPPFDYTKQYDVVIKEH